MSLTIEEFDTNELRARPLGGKLIRNELKIVNFYYGDDRHRVPILEPME